MKLSFYSYRYASEVLASPEFSAARDEALDILRRLQPLFYGDALWSKKARNPRSKHPVEQAAMNRWLDDEFDRSGWDVKPKIVVGSALEADFSKSRIQVEVQFGNMARWTYDIFKFQVSYSQKNIDIGIFAVPVARFCRYINSNVAQFERIVRELPHAELSITLPILVVGLEPDSYSALPET